MGGSEEKYAVRVVDDVFRDIAGLAQGLRSRLGTDRQLASGVPLPPSQ